MELDLNVLRPQERASLQLRLLYEQEGFRKYHMGRFEEYGLYQENRRFLSSEQVITFTDLDGRLLALKPDVVFAYDWSDMNRVENLRNLGMNVIVLKGPATIEDIRQNVRTIAKAMHADSKGEELVKLMDSRLAQVKQQVEALKLQKKKKIVLVSLMSSYGGKGCIFDDMCKEAGVINGVSAAGIKNGQQVTKEMLVKIDPDLLIMPVYNDHGNFDIKKYNQEFLEDPSLQTMRAIKSKQLFYPNEGYIYNCSQDVVFGVQEIAHAAYGEAFAIQGAQHLRVK